MASSFDGGYAPRHTLRAEESKQQLSPALPVFINPRGAAVPLGMWPRNFRRPHESIEAQPSTARCQAPLGARCDHFITSPRGLKLGDVVTFTDDFGVAFSDLKVTGFTPCVVGHVALASFHTGILYPNVTVLGRPGAEVWMIVGSSRGRKIAEFAVHEGKAHALVC